ncbi:MAG: hypothetical protein R3E84_12745 [Pseudomonadales bacterium]
MHLQIATAADETMNDKSPLSCPVISTNRACRGGFSPVVTDASTQIPHSHPRLTLNTRSWRSVDGDFVHEQSHWLSAAANEARVGAS